MDAKWDYEAAYYVREGRMFDGDYEKARNFVVAKWLYLGDFRPLAEAIRRGSLDELVTGMMLHLIEVEGSLRVAHRRRYRPKNPAADVQRLAAAFHYENGKGKSDARILDLAAALNMSPAAVRKAVTKSRRASRK